jgi:hypothetical protein
MRKAKQNLIQEESVPIQRFEIWTSQTRKRDVTPSITTSDVTKIKTLNENRTRT